MKRFWQIDFLRGLALIMMFIFHFFWDLKYFDLIDFDIYSGLLGFFQISIGSLFLFLSGFSLVLSFSKHKKKFPIKWFFRTSKIAIVAFFVSVFTLIFFPDYFIYFGILHLLSFCSFLFAPLANRPFFALLLSFVIFYIHLFFNPYFFGNDFLLLAFHAPRDTLDFYPLIPWSALFLLGVFFGNFALKLKLLDYSEQKNRFLYSIAFLGKNSLAFYLLHQAFLFPFVWLIYILL